MKKLVTKFMKLEWYYQLFIALISFVSLALLIKFLLWIVPFVFGFLMLMWIFTNGEIFSLLVDRRRCDRTANLFLKFHPRGRSR